MWSFVRGQWCDLSAGGKGTTKGVPQKPGEREEVLVEVALAPAQRRCYRALYERNVDALQAGARRAN